VRFFVTMILCVAFAQLSSQSDSAVRILRTGTYRNRRPLIKTSEQWLGLREVESAWDVIAVTPEVATGDRICGEPSTKISTISTDLTGTFVILFTGVPNASEGRVSTTINRARVLYPGEVASLGAGYILKALGSASREPSGPILLNYTLLIFRGQQSQRIAFFERNAMANPRQVVWGPGGPATHPRAGERQGAIRPTRASEAPSAPCLKYWFTRTPTTSAESYISSRCTRAPPRRSTHRQKATWRHLLSTKVATVSTKMR
jgi:hypothetical protein